MTHLHMLKNSMNSFSVKILWKNMLNFLCYIKNVITPLNRNIKSYVFVACVPACVFSKFLLCFSSFFLSTFNDVTSYRASRFTGKSVVKMCKNRKISFE